MTSIRPDTEPGAPCITLPLTDSEATDRIGAALGRALCAGDTVLLSGELGTGKTALARAAIAARLADVGRAEDIPSPTFTLVQTYEADIPVWHADLYRLSDPDEVMELGLEDAFQTAACLVEWPDRLGGAVPDRHVAVEMQYMQDGRLMTLIPAGSGWQGVLDAVRSAI